MEAAAKRHQRRVGADNETHAGMDPANKTAHFSERYCDVGGVRAAEPERECVAASEQLQIRYS